MGKKEVRNWVRACTVHGPTERDVDETVAGLISCIVDITPSSLVTSRASFMIYAHQSEETSATRIQQKKEKNVLNDNN